MAASTGDVKTLSEGNLSKFTQPLHAKSILAALNEGRKNPSLCDGIVIVGEKEIPVQRSMLAASSPYFRYPV